jgi:hypothetical protein
LSDYFNISPLRPTEAHAPHPRLIFSILINVDLNHVHKDPEQINGLWLIKQLPLNATNNGKSDEWPV